MTSSQAERIARQEQRSDDTERRLAGIETTVREIVGLLTELREDIHQARGRSAAFGSVWDVVKLLAASAFGAISGAVAASWRVHP